MFTMPFRKREREQGAFLNKTQRTLINEKFEILQQASFGFTQDRLLHISQEESKGWTKECTDELRREIGGGVPIRVEIRSGSSGPPCRCPVETDNNRGPVSFRLVNVHSRIALAWSKYV
jgi:hypothetical protein